LWRRISGGLTERLHQEIWAFLKPFLAARISPHPPKHLPRPKGIQPEGLDEMARLACSLEHLEPGEKAELGGWISARLQHPETATGPWTWALGRLGARVPICGSVHKVVEASKAAEWDNLLLDPAILRLDGSLFAIAQLTRLTGDRTRDLDESVRLQVQAALRAADASPAWQRMVSEVVALDKDDNVRALGDSLPVGLVLPDPGPL
jgi:hypothetical protein